MAFLSSATIGNPRYFRNLASQFVQSSMLEETLGHRKILDFSKFYLLAKNATESIKDEKDGISSWLVGNNKNNVTVIREYLIIFYKKNQTNLWV